ncbi:hypothetical protein R3P38DRAFT_2517108 [Favolaschia claudopus]|uniref:Uncharacterized protein n=1 Tax=Favolaschia claudopus TaxID=2862362 RepID=A0AAW0CCJ6_9AGAR
MSPRPSKKKAKPLTEPVTIDFEEPYGSITTRIDSESKIHYAICDLCGTQIKMTVSANRYNLLLHRNNEVCKTQPNFNRAHVRQESLGYITAGLAQLGQHQNRPLQIETPRSSTPLPRKKTCPGVAINWTVGSHWMTYPYLQHGVHSLGWEPIGFGTDNTMQFRAENCLTQVPAESGLPCIPCQALPSSSRFLRFIDSATESLPHTPWEYLSAAQQLKIMKSMAKSQKDLRTQLNNSRRSTKAARMKISEYRRIMMLLATNDVPGLRRLLTVKAKNGAGPRAIAKAIVDCMHHLYSPRGGFSARDLDLSFLAKAIGGPRLLYALQKAFGLASVSTIRRHAKVPKLVPSIGVPLQQEIYDNISSFLDPEIKPPPQVIPGQTLPGNVVMFDGVALEPKCRYCPIRNAILGLCREHSHRVNTAVDTLDSVESVRTALQKDKDDPDRVCFGTDATVVAIAPYARDDHYTPVPIVVSPSDKTETGEQLAKWMQVILDVWETHPQGKILHGPIDALASDGDSTYRLAKHIICMVKETDPNSALGKIICPLLGINRFTSKNGQLSTCDPKHIFKRTRDATLLRNLAGIMIGESLIQPLDIVQHLSALPEVTLEAAKQLLDPADKQNVPKAVSLIQQLRKLDGLVIPPHTSEAKMRKSVVFFSKVLSYFVVPFITVEMSLSEQVTSLSTYAFLSAALQIKHGSFCFTGPLYADSQATIKNIIFTIAKMQIINPNLRFYIILEGTDRLELVFSDCRTQDHARNFDIEQLAGKLGVGALINAAFQRNPDLDRGHRRLSLSGALGMDHVNPRSWKGDTCVGNVNIAKCWKDGELAANDLLESHFGPSGKVDFERIFAQPGFDLLRPCGVYVGLDPKHEDKRSEEEDETTLFPEIHNNGDPSDNTRAFNQENLLSTEEVQSVQNEFGTQEEHQDMPLGLDLDQFFPDEQLDEEDHRDDPQPAAFSKFLEVEGKRYLKSSLVASLSSNRSKKVTMRTLRVRGVALEDFRSKKFENFDATEMDDDNLLKTGDLVASLVHTGGKVSLGIFMVKAIRTDSDKSTRTSISLNDLESPEIRAQIVGQLMEMRNPEVDKKPADLWEWTGKFLSLEDDSKQGRETRRRFVAEIPGILVHPVAPSVTVSTTSDSGPTWGVPTAQLDEILKDAWELLEPETPQIAANIAQLSEVWNSDSFPYPDARGIPSLIVQNVPAHLTRTKLRAGDKVSCFLCGTETKLNGMRSHVGKHILMSLRGVPEPGLLQPVGSEPCGFCGREGCFTQLINTNHPKKPPSILSSCPYHYSGMNYRKAQTSTKTSPSTNVPILCSLCLPNNNVSRDQPTIWKYNAMYHVIVVHSLHKDTVEPIPPAFMKELFIRRVEEEALGIAAAQTTQWRQDNQIPDSDQLFPPSDPPEPQTPRDKRPRADTGSTTSTMSDTDRHASKRPTLSFTPIN